MAKREQISVPLDLEQREYVAHATARQDRAIAANLITCGSGGTAFADQETLPTSARIAGCTNCMDLICPRSAEGDLTARLHPEPAALFVDEMKSPQLPEQMRRGRRVNRASTCTATAPPKGAKSGGSTLEGCNHGRTRRDHNQLASNFGPNELRAIATSGDTTPFGWDYQL
jgi:hypothetical protein